MSDRRRGDRRRGRRPGGRRVSDPIVDLAKHPESHVYGVSLAEYWGVDRSTVFRWCQSGRLRGTFDQERREWRVAVLDALAFEAADPFWRKRRPAISPLAVYRSLLAAAEAEVARLRALISRRAS